MVPPNGGSLVLTSWLSPDPVWSGALVLIVGFSVGLFGLAC